jgi:sulfate transport system permease protein
MIGAIRLRRHSVIPGFGLTLGFTVLYLSLIVIIPMSGLVFKTATLTWESFWSTITTPRVLAAYKLSFATAFAAGLINAVFGLLLAWVLVRYRFVGKRIVDALVDLPFALPTAIAGITLTALLAPTGWLGEPLQSLGIKVAYTPIGITIALVFIGLPFVVRTVQPVLEDLQPEYEEAAAILGANRLQVLRTVVFPEIMPALLTGFALAFARATGEYGSIVFISGNMPMKTEIVPLLIVTKLEQYDYAGATAVALVMLTLSFIVLLSINLLQWWVARHQRAV